ncbi:ABC transporter substrate-binding protein [Poseidonibacter ostreae]|uniref:ABC transporter substrate-binding protein n=1 Tax=Poseidonibacter ostreae TaxID=2654171 RepID=A0A6L4WQE7_9BACT|nr:ABC transporter substrate-binding protein [Poseidonibacter ostreae]KAB7886478.1 ABC transporter substrate-binding protein [Poseidonibacter ostreae]KAB7887459.1 ABC transporter substrate-binding protein [Poseidonibacter ostreae]KAB7891838.1 ABC transporter substrate-binding protein [Poseidonibacter ostreae]MAC83330.1 ABC transporter substrate-binding protein [Arcobacter sp.]
MLKKIIISFALLLVVNINADEKLEKIVLSGPVASVSHPLIHMVKTGALNDIAKNVEFKLWKNPDELRALTLRNRADFIAVPINVAANLHNKGVDIKLLNVSVWGILGMITRDKTLKTLADFKGKEIAMPFRADMPDIIFEELVRAQGMDPKKDFKLKYMSNPFDAMQNLILRQVDHALLAEPAISIALKKTGSFPLKLIAPDLYRSADLQDEWGKVFNVEAKVPQAGMSVIGDMILNKKVIKRFNEEYEKSLNWYKNNPKEAAKMVVEEMPMLDELGVEESIKHVQLNTVSAQDSKADLEFFYKLLEKNNPKTIGGKLPSDSFYF